MSSSSFDPALPEIPALEYLAYARRKYLEPVPGALDLGSSGVPWLAPAELWEALEELGGVAAFVNGSGPEQLRGELAARYARPVAHTGLARGTSGALYTVLRALVTPGARLVVEAPVYEPLRRVAEGLGYEIVPAQRDARRGYAIDPAEVARLALDPMATGHAARDDSAHRAPAHVLLSDPHNPSGASLEPAALAELAERLRPHARFLILDEVYRDFHIAHDGLRTAAALGENVVAMNSFTKVYGLGWARIGWFFAHPRLVQAAEEVGRHVLGDYGFDYAAWGLAVLRRRDELLERAFAVAEGKLERLAHFVEAHAEHVCWHRPRAGLLGFLRSADGTSLASLCDVLPRFGVIVAPGRYFGDETGLRIGCAAALTDFERGLERLGKALTERQAPPSPPS